MLAQNEQLRKVLDESEMKKLQVTKISAEQNIKVENLKRLTDEINLEKLETEKSKEEAIKIAEKLSNKDITEVNS